MSLLKKIKKSDRPAVSLVPSWHPNFRNFDRLPDVKMVRTSFFVNFLSIAVVSGLLLYFGLQEYNLHTINVQINVLQRQIDEKRNPSEQAVQLYRQFQDEEKKIAEVAAFVKTAFVRSDFIIELGQSLPKNIVLDSINLDETAVTLHGNVRGTSSDDAFGQAQAYINQLQADSSLNQKFETITMPNIDPDTKPNQMVFEILMKPKGKGKP